MRQGERGAEAWEVVHTQESAVVDHTVHPGMKGVDVSGRARLRDEELLLLIAQGDAQALGELYDRYGRLVFSIALHVTDDHRCADDVTEDVFHRVWTRASDLRLGAESPVSWIIGLTRRRAIDEIRSSHYRGRQRTVWRDSQSLMGGRESANDAEHAALQCAVRAALAMLSDEQRQAIDLAYYRGLTATEIASMAATTAGTVKSRLRCGLTALRDALRHDTGQANPTSFVPEQPM